MVTPDGDPVPRTETERRPYQKREVLLADVNEGLSTEAIAEKYGVGATVIRRHMLRLDVPRPGRMKETYDYTAANAAHQEAKIPLNPTQFEPAEGADPVERADGGMDFWPCPECGERYTRREGQQNCMRGHSREHADELQSRADAGEEVLVLNV